MNVYKLTKQGAAELKRSWVITMTIAYLAITGAFYYSLVYKSGDNEHRLIFIAMIIILFAGIFFGRKKYFDGVDSSELLLADEKLTLHALNLPDKVIDYKDIKEIKAHKRGIGLLTKNKPERLLVIIRQFEDLDEIERKIRKKIAVD